LQIQTAAECLGSFYFNDNQNDNQNDDQPEVLVMKLQMLDVYEIIIKQLLPGVNQPRRAHTTY